MIEIQSIFYTTCFKLIFITYSQMQKQNTQVIDDGFSSQEEFRHEQILVDNAKKQEQDKHHRQQVKFKIPPPQQIKHRSYSLKPDIATGWNKKQEGPVPVPLCFQEKKVNLIVRKIQTQKNIAQKYKLCYLGPRFQSTFYAWYDQNFQFPYSNFKAPKNMKFTDRAFCGQHWDAEQNLIFDSIFESGNLDCAIQVDQNQYDLYLRVDSNTRGHLNWYNFKIKNMSKLKKYRINICNLQKTKTLYSRGMKPYIFSYKKYEKTKKGWQQGGNSIKYQQKFSKTLKLLNLEYCNFCKLSFQIYSQYDKDTIQIAYCVPYTYTELITYLNNLEKKLSDKDYFSMSNLCTSLGGLSVPIITITDNKIQSHEYQQDQRIQRKCVIVSGRVHPGQSNSSYMMQGFLDFLCGNSKQAKELRKYFIFKIVPMLNPDGVCLGNYRTGISGKDFNREYKNPDKVLFPQIHAFKKLASENKAIYKENLIMFMDFHGHSTKKNVFMYGPQYSIIKKQYYESRIFPKILSDQTNMFRYYSCSFKISEDKKTTARAIFLKNISIPFSFTVEASNGSFYDKQSLKDHLFTSHQWFVMGKHLCKALASYCDLIINSQRQRLIKKKQKDKKQKKNVKIRSTKKYKEEDNLQIRPQNKQRDKSKFSFLKDDFKYKKYIDEIKQIEQRRINQQNQEDEISEGSSDGEGEKDDLPSMKLNLLYQTIKNRKGYFCQKFKNQNRLEMINHENQNNFGEISNQFFQSNAQKMNQQLKQHQKQVKKLKNYRRIGRLKNNRIQQTAEENSQKMLENTPKIINFSFFCMAHNPSINLRNGRRISVKGNKSLQLYSQNYMNQSQKANQTQMRKSRGKITCIPRQTRVLDLSVERSKTQRHQSVKKGQQRRIITSGIQKIQI